MGYDRLSFTIYKWSFFAICHFQIVQELLSHKKVINSILIIEAEKWLSAVQNYGEKLCANLSVADVPTIQKPIRYVRGRATP